MSAYLVAYHTAVILFKLRNCMNCINMFVFWVVLYHCIKGVKIVAPLLVPLTLSTAQSFHKKLNILNNVTNKIQ